MRLLRPLFSPFTFVKPPRLILLRPTPSAVRHYDLPRTSDVLQTGTTATAAEDSAPEEAGPETPEEAGSETSSPPTENVNRTLKIMNRYMVDRQPGKAVNFFLEIMQEHFRHAGRARMFVGMVNLFLRRGHMREAMQVYSYMVAEGFIPEPKLKAVMFVLRYIASHQTGHTVHVSTILDAVRPVFADKEFDEACLRFLVFKLYQLFKIKVSVVVQIMETYFQARPTETTLTPETIEVLKYVCARLSMPDEPPTPDYRVRIGRQEPLVDADALLTFAQHTRPGAQARSALLSQVFQDSTPDSAGVRSLLAFFAKNRCYEWTLEMYRLLATMGGKAYHWKTFSIMFTIVRIFSRRRSIRQRGVRKPHGLPTLHDLFRDMLASHLAYTVNRPRKISTVLNGTILCRALHAFVWQEDYAAAFIVLGTFKNCGLPITIDTYRNALGGLVDRLQAETPFIDLERVPQHWYTYRFMGCVDPNDIPSGLDLVNAVLTVGEESRIHLEPIPLKEPVTPEREDQYEAADGAASTDAGSENPNPNSITIGRRRTYHAMPTAFELLGVAPAQKNEYSIVPLQQIMRRAMLAIPRETFVAPSTYTSMLVRELKQVMIPRQMLTRGQHKPRFGARGGGAWGA